MLAQNFMTAEALGITEDEVSALIKVLGMLERGEITSRQFDMKSYRNECGTIGCLCGWASMISKGRAFPEIREDHTSVVTSRQLFVRLPLEAMELLGIGCSPLNVETAGPAQAAIALRNYLTTGEARWNEAIAQHLDC